MVETRGRKATFGSQKWVEANGLNGKKRRINKVESSSIHSARFI